MRLTETRLDEDRDSGAILLLVLAVSIVLSLVVLALANFVAADLRYSQVVDAQAKRLASAESGIDYAVDRLRLNQTLCATDVANSEVSLHGSTSLGTLLPQSLNGTDTRITCQRLDGGVADVAGWAVVITDPLSLDFPLQVNINATVPVGGPVYVRDPDRRATDFDSRIELVDGDLWYKGIPNCNTPKRSSDLGVGLFVGPDTARGPECTTRAWNELFSTPLFASLPTDPNPPPDSTSFPGCLVFSPGRYDTVPNVPTGTHVYFRSGDYHLAFNSTWKIYNDTTVWIGHAGSLAGFEEVPNVPCEAARAADPDQGGATFYFDGTSGMLLETEANVEMFARQHGQYMVSVQALPGSTSSPSAPLIRTFQFGIVNPSTDLVIHGLVWAPDGWFTIDNSSPGSLQKLLGGIVVGGLLTPQVDVTSTLGIPNFEIRPATSTVDTRVLLTSTSTLNGVTTKVEAVVAYRPHASNLDNRVAVSSFRVVD